MRVGEREMEKSTLRQRARDLRKNSTDAERHLWYHLRANRLGFKFKREVPIGAYIVDFVCLEKRLIIELDMVVNTWIIKFTIRSARIG